MDFADPSHSRTRPKGVGYRFCFMGRAIGSGWQGPPKFQGMGRPHHAGASAKTRDSDGLALSEPRHRNGPLKFIGYYNSELPTVGAWLPSPIDAAPCGRGRAADDDTVGAYALAARYHV
jgi:hypothetical protein